MTDWPVITERIQNVVAHPVQAGTVRSLSGGCISSAYVLGDGEHPFFVKIGVADNLDMFEAEAEGLEELGKANCISVPKPVCSGIAGNDSFLVMEYLALGGDGSPAQLGEQLAAMHQVHAQSFGWHRDNTIGSTPQINQREDDWVNFWCQHRLGFQLNLARQEGAGERLQQQGKTLSERLPWLFSDYQPAPSLLHGDLWSGNYGYMGDGRPVIFDPAVYFGDRETDLAMTELFGGFPPEFYSAYQAAYPLDAGYAVRKTLYQLYHILNHYNLFGGGYLAQAESMIGRLLSELN